MPYVGDSLQTSEEKLVLHEMAPAMQCFSVKLKATHGRFATVRPFIGCFIMGFP